MHGYLLKNKTSNRALIRKYLEDTCYIASDQHFSLDFSLVMLLFYRYHDNSLAIKRVENYLNLRGLKAMSI